MQLGVGDYIHFSMITYPTTRIATSIFTGISPSPQVGITWLLNPIDFTFWCINTDCFHWHGNQHLSLSSIGWLLMLLSSQEFLKLVMEQGRVFTQVDYASALTLLANSQPQCNEVRLENNLEKLDQMFADEAC